MAEIYPSSFRALQAFDLNRCRARPPSERFLLLGEFYESREQRALQRKYQINSLMFNVKVPHRDIQGRMTNEEPNTSRFVKPYYPMSFSLPDTGAINLFWRVEGRHAQRFATPD